MYLIFEYLGILVVVIVVQVLGEVYVYWVLGPLGVVNGPEMP